MMRDEATGLDFTEYDPQVNANNEIVSQPGVYVICKRHDANVVELRIDKACEFIPGYQVLYVGKTNSSLRRRIINQHFRGSGRNSTLRRTIGNLLGYEHFLLPDGRFRFISEHEQALTLYMAARFIVFYSITDQTEHNEHVLIMRYAPPLNHIT